MHLGDDDPPAKICRGKLVLLMLLSRFWKWLEECWNAPEILGRLILPPSPFFFPILLFVLIVDAFLLVVFFVPRTILHTLFKP